MRDRNYLLIVIMASLALSAVFVKVLNGKVAHKNFSSMELDERMVQDGVG